MSHRCAMVDCNEPVAPECWVEVDIDDEDILYDGQHGPLLARLGVCGFHDQAIANSPGIPFSVKALVDEQVVT